MTLNDQALEGVWVAWNVGVTGEEGAGVLAVQVVVPVQREGVVLEMAKRSEAFAGLGEEYEEEEP